MLKRRKIFCWKAKVYKVFILTLMHKYYFMLLFYFYILLAEKDELMTSCTQVKNDLQLAKNELEVHVEEKENILLESKALQGIHFYIDA